MEPQSLQVRTVQNVATDQLRLETPRLTLRPLRDDDLDEICSLLGDADALALWGDALDRDGARQWIERNTARYAADGFGRCAIATEAAQAWRDHAFTQLRLDRIVSMIAEQNVASRRVAEKLGMTVERTAVWGDAPMLMYTCEPTAENWGDCARMQGASGSTSLVTNVGEAWERSP